MATRSFPSESSRARRQLLLDAAARAESLVPVSLSDAAAWRAEWRAILRSILPARRLRLLKPWRGVPRLSRPPLPSELPPVGSWVSFRPHISSSSELFKVIAFVPIGVAIDEVLPADMLHLLQDGIRKTCTHGDRVVLGEPGGMHLIASLRTALAGAVAARAVIVPSPSQASPSRLVVPHAPGTQVVWEWHSSFGRSRHHGVVVAYVPGGTPLEVAAPGANITSRLRRLSNLDRYLVEVAGRGSFLTPPAFLVECPKPE